jgi:hypothetical protein
MPRFLSQILLFVLIISIGSITTFAANSINDNAGTSSFAFMKINVSARPVAMGGAFTGLADDESSLYYNPAGIGLIENDRFIFGYHDYFVGMQSGFVGLIHPLDYTNVLGMYVSYLNYGDLIEADEQGNELGTFGGGDMLFGLTFARNINQRVQIGATAKFAYEKIDQYSASALAFDLGLRMTSDRGRMTGGLMIQNLGTTLSSLGEDDSFDLPLTFRLGGSAKPRGMDLIIAADLVKPRDNDILLAVGGESFHFDPLLIRLGYNTVGSEYETSSSDASWTGISLGFGLNLKKLGPLAKAQISYSYTPAADLGTSHRITLTGGK